MPVGVLFVVGTPIGNLEDITMRALRVLREADLIAAEDTRRTRKLLSHYDIHTPLTSYHEHNKRARTPQLIAKLKNGAAVALVSDAGMPGISDPGHDLIVSALVERIDVTVVPGPTSIIAALVVSGMKTDRFAFVGFPPRKPGERRRYLEGTLTNEPTSVMFESPNRLLALLDSIANIAPTRRIAVARELTKKFEETVRGTAAEAAAHFREQEPRGECVVVIEGACEAPRQHADLGQTNVRELVQTLTREKGLTRKSAMREAAKALGISRREVYRRLLEEGADA
ncbi:MAG: 16S rRNA (cytidine(1402)-2'-O)-methyltransferase [Candidatus Abyssobacteria bacterium SURF_17]|uniref:Ribosomal RNA small subunit methyltransferase I n=1 Tax=Candidatus Abyssobacteria bacterium SURF_17 TaxID=2093361 RepID=A0A419ESP7_9BACT|nr:MAG: 16S rRNA (cytidine(1402)-2'-O)-methyltransferase [Candidatus Abyssubacteria bacterium SURF_17]